MGRGILGDLESVRRKASAAQSPHEPTLLGALSDRQFLADVLQNAALYMSDPENAMRVGSLATTGVPVVSDALGLGADALMYARRPEERTLGNFALTGIGALPFIPAMAGVTKSPASQFFRGFNPGDTRRIKTGDDFWDSLYFVSPDKKAAEAYGRTVISVKPKEGAKILVEGTADFRRLGGGRKAGKSLLEWASDITKNAKTEGYDAVQFSSPGDVGTAIINKNAFDIPDPV